MIRELLKVLENWLRRRYVEPTPVPVRVRNDSENHVPNRPSSKSINHFLLLNPNDLQSGSFRSSGIFAVITLCFILMSPLPAPQDSSKTILFLGDSLTAGYGIDESQAFPALIEKKLSDAGMHYKVVNAGLSGDTSSGGLRRINWLLRSPVDVLVLELGANDGLRGINLSVTEQNLQGIIDRTRDKYPDVKVVVVGMQVPPNLGEEYTSEFRELFPRLAKNNDAYLIPFLLEGVAGNAELNLADGIHPTPAGHKLMSETVWKYLKPVL